MMMFKDRLQRNLFLAWLALCFERLSGGILASLILLCFYLACALALPAEGTQSIIRFSLWGGIQIAIILWTIRNFQAPQKSDVARYLETQHHVRHRPLDALVDTPFNTGIQTQALWQSYQTKQKATLNALPNRLYGLYFSRIDPFSIRIFSLLLFITAIGLNLGQATPRIAAAFPPFQINNNGNAETAKNFHNHIWILPPQYTGRPDIKLNGYGLEKMTDLPQGSEIRVLTRSYTFGILPLNLKWPGRNNAMPLTKIDSQNYAGQSILPPPSPEAQNLRLQIKEGPFTKTDWPVTFIPDKAPLITKQPMQKIEENGVISLPLMLKDDYGVTALHFDLQLDNSQVLEGPIYANPYSERRPIAVPGGETPQEITQKLDLTSHLWAGLPVTLTIKAEDAASQMSGIRQIQMILPERAFSHPVARYLIEQRQSLAWNGIAALEDVAEALIHATSDPAKLNDDSVAFLTLSSAFYRIIYAPSEKTVKELIPLLWDVAMRLEDFGHSKRVRELAQAIENMMQSLNEGASDEELAKRFEELAQNLDSYVDSLRDQIERDLKQIDPEGHGMLPQERAERMIDRQDFDQFMRNLLGDLEQGDSDSAKDKLSRLQDFLQNIVPDLQQRAPQAMQFSMESANELEKLIESQEELLDVTKDLAQTLQSSPSSQTAQSAQNRHIEQKALRNILGELMRESSDILGKIPEGLGEAEFEMRKSETALRQINPQRSIPAQQNAIDYLRQGQQNMMEEMQQQMMAMMNPMFAPGEQQGGIDPLGRRRDESGQNRLSGSDVEIPDEATQKRLRDILNTLRDRAGDYTRPKSERDYLNRLLKQF